MSKKTADFMSAVFVLYLRNVKGGVPYKKLPYATADLRFVYIIVVLSSPDT